MSMIGVKNMGQHSYLVVKNYGEKEIENNHPLYHNH